MAKLIVDGNIVETTKDTIIAVNYAVNEFFTVGKRKGHFSKSIVVPASKQNLTIFGQPELLENHIKLTARIVTRSGVLTFEGFAELKNASKKILNLTLTSNNGGWVSLVGEKLLTALPMGNVLYDSDEIEAAWELNSDKVTYPLIDNNTYSNAGDTVADINFRPAVYIQSILESIFGAIGYTVKANLSMLKWYKRLILPSTNKIVQPVGSTIVDNTTEAEQTVTQDMLLGDVVIMNNEISDPNNNYSTVTGEYTAPFAGSYDVEIGEFNLDITTIIGAQSRPATLHILIAVNNVFRVHIQTLSFAFAIGPIGYTIAGNTYTIEVDAGDTITFEVQHNDKNNNVEFTQLDTSNSDFKITPNALQIVLGQYYSVASVLPEGMKQIELIQNLVKNFNLYIDTDDDTREVNLYTFDDYYLNHEDPEDWTDKVDSDSMLWSKFKGLKRDLAFGYIKDEGDINAVTGFGNVDILLEDEYLVGAQNVKTSFAATQMTQTLTTSLNVPLMVNDETLLAPADKDDWGLEPRILVYDGLVAGIWDYTKTSVGTFEQSEFPSAYFSNPQHTFAKLDLDFGVDFGVILLTQPVIDIYNEGKMFTGLFNLNDLDIQKLNFRRLVRVDNNLFIINKVLDYRHDSRKLTKVELIHLE